MPAVAFGIMMMVVIVGTAAGNHKDMIMVEAAVLL